MQVGGPIWLYHVMRYMRKPNAPMDLEFLLYFVFSGADYLSGSLVIVLLLVGAAEIYRCILCYPD